MKTMWAVSSGSYSDYRVHAVCDSEATAKTIVARANADANTYERYEIEELAFIDDPTIKKAETLRLRVNIWDDGTETQQSETFIVEWPFDTLWDLTDCSWRLVRAPIHNGKGGRIEVWGTDHERVRKVFGERRALFHSDDAFRSKREIKG